MIHKRGAIVQHLTVNSRIGILGLILLRVELLDNRVARTLVDLRWVGLGQDDALTSLQL